MHKKSYVKVRFGIFALIQCEMHISTHNYSQQPIPLKSEHLDDYNRCSRYERITDTRLRRIKLLLKQGNDSLMLYKQMINNVGGDMVEWLRCSTRIHKVLCSNLSITTME